MKPYQSSAMASKKGSEPSISGTEESKSEAPGQPIDWEKHWKELDLGSLTEAQIDDLWNGLDTLIGSGEGYVQAAEWWNRVPKKYAAHVAKACVVLFDKPPRLIAAGKLKSKGDQKLDKAKMADERLSRFLPVIPGGYVVEEGQKDGRVGWRGFRNTNVTMTKRIAKMLICSRATQYPAVAKWIEKYGGEFGRIDKQSKGYVKVSSSAATKAIFDAHDADVVAWKSVWDPIFKAMKP